MRKTLIILITYLIFFLTLAFSADSVFAQASLKDAFKSNGALLDKAAAGSGYDTTSSLTINNAIAKVINLSLSFLGVIFLCLTIYGGFLWMTARGNEQQVEKAKEVIIASIIGLIIVLGAYAISYFVISRFTDKILKPMGS